MNKNSTYVDNDHCYIFEQETEVNRTGTGNLRHEAKDQ